MISYNVKKESNRRPSDASNAERYSRHPSATVEHGLIPWRKNSTLPVLKTATGMTWGECIFQFFFSIQGPAFYMLPSGFRDVGYVPGIVGSFAVGVFYVRMMQMYLRCEKELRKRNDIADETHLSIFSLVDLVFVDCGKMAVVGALLNLYLKYEIILSWSVSLSFNELFVGHLIQLILGYFEYSIPTRSVMLALFPFTTLMAFVPDLKVMSLIAYCSTLIIVLNMFGTMYFVLVDPTPLAPIVAVGNLSKLSIFLPTLFFTINCTPLIFPLKQEMRKPKQFGSWWGSLNASIYGLILLNVCFSMCAYIRYGAYTQDNLLENLPGNKMTAVSTCLLTAAIIAAGAISFFVIFETVWCDELLALVADSRYLTLYEYAARTSINLFITVMAIIIPSLDLFILLISSFSYPFDSIFLPALLELMVQWKYSDSGLRLGFVIVKTTLLIVLCIAFSYLMIDTFLVEMSLAYGSSS